MRAYRRYTASIVAVLTMLAVTIAANPATASADTYDLPPACETAVRDTHAYLKAQPEIDIHAAMSELQEKVFPACDISLEAAAINSNASELERLISTLTGETTRSSGSPRMVLKVPCSLPGSGSGSIQAYILGLPIGNAYTAAGAWETPADSALVAVTGEGGVVGGSQHGGVGSMLLGPVPLPSLGETNGWCNQVEEATVTEATCWWLVIYTHCTQEVSVRITLVPCGSDATQYFLVRGLLQYGHTYSEEVVCE